VQCVTPSSKGEKIFFRNFFYVENLVEPPPLRSSSSTYWISTQHPWSSFFSYTAAGKLRKILRAETTPYEYGASFSAQKEKKYFFEKISMSKSWSSSHPWGRAPRPNEFRPSILGRAFFQIMQLWCWEKIWELKPPPMSTVHHSQLKRRKIFFFKKNSMSKSWLSPHPWGRAPRPTEFQPSILGRPFFLILQLWGWEKKWELKPPFLSAARHSQLKRRKNIFLEKNSVENLVEPPPMRSSSSTSWISTQHPWSSFFSDTAAEKLKKKLRAETTPYEYGASFPAQKEKKYFFWKFFYVENFVEPPPLRSSSSTSWISTQHPWSSFFSNTAAGKLRKNLRAKTTPCEYDASLPA
jgi:hypothetical protein